MWKLQSALQTSITLCIEISMGHWQCKCQYLNFGCCCRNESGVLSQLVVFTFVTDKTKPSAAGQASQSPNSSPHRKTNSHAASLGSPNLHPNPPKWTQVVGSNQAGSSQSSGDASSAASLGLQFGSVPATVAQSAAQATVPTPASAALHDAEAFDVISCKGGKSFQAVVVGKIYHLPPPIPHTTAPPPNPPFAH